MPAAEAPLGGAAFEGLARIAEAPARDMLTVKGPPDVLADAAGALGAAVPAPLRFEDGEGGRAAWMAPDELLLGLPPGRGAGTAARLASRLERRHALVADVSHARAVLLVEGVAARDVLAKLTPVDLRPAAFGPGAFRRTRLGQVAAALACEAPDRIEVLAMRSVADYALGLLRAAADPAAPLDLHRG